MKNKKNILGFTLVELLAVVVILSIIAIITIPIIGNVIEGVKKRAVESNANAMMSSGDMYYAKNLSKIEDKVEFEINNGIQVSEQKLDYKGKIKTGYLLLLADNKKAVCVDDGTYVAYKGLFDKKISLDKGICTGEWDEETGSYVISKTSGGDFMSLSIRGYESENELPTIGNLNDIAVITKSKITGYYVSSVAPEKPEEGMVWVVEGLRSPYYVESTNVRLGISYVMQYEGNKWQLKMAYVYNKEEWTNLYYIDIENEQVNLEKSNLGNLEITKTFGYTGKYGTFTAGFSGYYNVQLWGAQGGAIWLGGRGAYTEGDIFLNAGDTLYFYVGGAGSGATGGWNGGGNGKSNSDSDRRYGRGGGGATDVRLVSTSAETVWNEYESLESRIMVAAGGGGDAHRYYTNDSGNYYSNGYGGAGGGIIGINGYVNAAKNYSAEGHQGTGGTQAMGGYSLSSQGYAGAFGVGGTSGSTGAGGGGGYYGGGSSYIGGAGAGGGSSYISGHRGCNSVSLDSSLDKIVHTGSAYHGSGYYFINTKMIDGLGKEWEEENYKSTATNQPNTAGTGLQAGQTGNGYAKVTIKTVEYHSKKELKEQEKDELFVYDYSGLNINNGRYQMFTAPKDGYYKMETWGAQGGAIWYGGRGSYSAGKIYLKKGTTLYIYVGGNTRNAAGGWNGGGNGASNSDKDRRYGYGGGGATDIRTTPGTAINKYNEFESLASRIMVAAGGGGDAHRYYAPESGNYYSNGYGGNAGGFVGYDGYVATYKNGWSSNGNNGLGAEGAFGGYTTNSQNNGLGGFGYGGTTASTGAGGGGGYYGGGASHIGGVGAGGGSSYISGHTGCNSISEISTEINRIHAGTKYHYSGYYFTDTLMIDGANYIWEDKKTETTRTIPGYLNIASFGSGNTSNGYARITLLEEKTITQEDIVETQWDYSYSGNNLSTGNYQIFTASSDGYYEMETWGAQGGAIWYGGRGAYTKGKIYLKKGTVLYVYVGGTTHNAVGGWNGGGSSTSWSSGDDRRYGYGGGGATDIRIEKGSTISKYDDFNSLASRIMVAAGGGGDSHRYYAPESGNYYSYGYGGNAGGLNGYNGYVYTSKNGWGVAGNNGVGAEEAFGGFAISNQGAGLGTFGKGGNYANYGGAGGGGGYYGGGGSNSGGDGAGGGSSYISGHEGSNSLSSEANADFRLHSGASKHSSGYYYTETVMIDGSNKAWRDYNTGNIISIPGYENISEFTSGNTGNGYARIKLVEKTSIEPEKEVEKNWDYSFAGTTINNGNYQIFIASADGYYEIQAWGAQGGVIWSGGKGSYTKGRTYLKKGTRLYIYVGGMTRNGSSGWNGGGNGKSYTGDNDRRYGYGGGGATDIRTKKTTAHNYWNEFDSLKTRIMVAAGGGGDSHRYYAPESGNYYSYGYGAAGGGLTGYSGYVATSKNGWGVAGNNGVGAEQSIAGYEINSQNVIGAFGLGGTTASTGAGGGGGYYGGGASHIGGDGAGSGSSYISGHAGCSSIASNSTTTNILHTGSKYHYSGYYFTDTQMIDGNGYSWTTGRSATIVNMPTHGNNALMTGNTGNGYVKIRLVNQDSTAPKTPKENLWTYSYAGNLLTSGTYQEFIATQTGTYQVELWGARGGVIWSGGLGGYTQGKISLQEGQKLYVYVGSMTKNSTGGWNGGGNGSSYTGDNDRRIGFGGGGATDIRIIPTSTRDIWYELTSLASRIMVAAGGGGDAQRYYAPESGNYYSNGYGGAGGGLNGYTGYVAATKNGWSTSGHQGTGATQISAGYTASSTGVTGLFGKGGTTASTGGGGGGGWYGGGPSHIGGVGAGGGSSYISGHPGCIAVNTSGTPIVSSYSKIEDSISNTKFKFSDTVMIDGAGYNWTTSKGSIVVNQPNNGGTGMQTGQSGNGYAKITFLG